MKNQDPNKLFLLPLFKKYFCVLKLFEPFNRAKILTTFYLEEMTKNYLTCGIKKIDFTFSFKSILQNPTNSSIFKLHSGKIIELAYSSSN